MFQFLHKYLSKGYNFLILKEIVIYLKKTLPFQNSWKPVKIWEAQRNK